MIRFPFQPPIAPNSASLAGQAVLSDPAHQLYDPVTLANSQNIARIKISLQEVFNKQHVSAAKIDP